MADSRCYVCDQHQLLGGGRRRLSLSANARNVSLVWLFLKSNLSSTLPDEFILCKSCYSKSEKGMKSQAFAEEVLVELRRLKFPSCTMNAGDEDNLMDGLNAKCDASVQTDFTHLIHIGPGSPVSVRKRHSSDYLSSTPKRQCSSTHLATPPSVVQILHKKRGQRTRMFNVATPLKPIAKSLRYGKLQCTVSSILNSHTSRNTVLDVLLKDIKKECRLLSSRKSSIAFRVTNIKRLESKNFDLLEAELSNKAPILNAVLKAACGKAKSSVPSIVAAAVLLKARNHDLCFVQSLISVMLYTGHASKAVYGRLNQLGVSVSHPTVSKLVKLCAKGHDRKVKRWQNKWSKQLQGSAFQPQAGIYPYSQGNSSSSESQKVDISSFIIVGDNIDKNVRPRDMRIDRQVESLHYFNSYAALDRVDFTGLSTHSCVNSPEDIMAIPISAILPNGNDCDVLRSNYIVLVARMIADRITYFNCMKGCIPNISHVYSQAMSKKSTTVGLGIIPLNENKTDEMTAILRELHNYVPHKAPDKYISIAFGGDQLTVERARVCQDLRKHSFDYQDQLGGLHPFAADWHAEAALLQIFFDRLYKGGSSQDGGTLTQLRNLVNRRNIKHDISGRFDAANDFFQMITRCHVYAFAMSFFGMEQLDSEPTFNVLPPGIQSTSKKQRWSLFSSLVGRMIDRFVIIRDYISVAGVTHEKVFPIENTSFFPDNPHCQRIMKEHSYCKHVNPPYLEKSSRRLPSSILKTASSHGSQQPLQLAKRDGVFSYACTVLTDGLLLLELRDAIHQGDGPRIIRCWKFMLLYFKHYGHHKYALEAFKLLTSMEILSPLVKQQVIWSRTVNTRIGPGHNIPTDLYNEHLNHTLKDCILGLGANVTKERIVSVSKSIQRLAGICNNADIALGIYKGSMHHTTSSSEKDERVVMEELHIKSHVFDYVPGRSHFSAQNLEPCIAKAINEDKLIKWINDQKRKLKMDF